MDTASRQRRPRRPYRPDHRIGGYQEPGWVARINEEIARERAEREAREALLPPKIGVDPTRPHHPLFNPEPGERERQEQSFLDSWATERARERTNSQQRHWQEAIRLIRSGTVLSYADLGSRFKLTEYDRCRRGGSRECFSAAWAYQLVRKMINRNVFTEIEVQQLIADTSSPFKRSKQQSTNHTASVPVTQGAQS